MSLFNQVAGALAQGAQGAAAGGRSELAKAIGGALGPLGGGAGAAPAAAHPLTGLLGAMGGTEGLMGLVAKFKQAGLGAIVESWIATGPNLPISPEQLKSVLGAPAVDGMAQQAGVSASDLLSSLAQTLPMIVDQLTPGGQLPTDGQLSPAAMKNLAGMLGQLGGR
jgi:uncharacterized protein YidB (DUF937 family)